MPGISGSSGATLGAQILVLALTVKKLPANIVEGLALFTVVTTNLQAAVHAAAADGGDGLIQPASNLEAGCFAGAESVLSGILKLPPEMEQVSIAKKLHFALFKDGLAFLRLPMLERWNETERRVRDLTEKKLAADFDAIGNGYFVAAIIKTHAATGAAAGITVARPQAPAVPLVGKALNEFRAALRTLMAQFIANSALDKTGAATLLSRKLLKPLADYVPPVQPKAAKSENKAEAPAEGAAGKTQEAPPTSTETPSAPPHDATATATFSPGAARFFEGQGRQSGLLQGPTALGEKGAPAPGEKTAGAPAEAAGATTTKI